MESFEATISTLTENQLWDNWRQATSTEKPLYAAALLKALQKHAHSVVWICLHEVRPEIVDEAVWKGFEKADTFRGQSSFTTWFHRIVINCCHDYLRAKQSKAEIPLKELATPTASDAHIELAQLISPLKARQKRLISLKLEGLNDAEIGKILGIKELAVRHFWTRTKNHIRQSAEHGRENVK